MNLTAIKEIFDRYAEEEYFSGVALIKKGDEEIFSYAHDYAHKGYQIKNNLSTRFDTASITKLFTAVSIFQLVEKKLISLEDKVLELLDLGETAISKEVTLYHLLTHTSGIGDDADEEAGESYEAIWQDKPSYTVRNAIDFLPNFIHREANFAPGEGCRYNNCAYILLGLVIEKITGQNYRDYVKEHIFDVVGMTETAFLSMDGVASRVAEGYNAIEDENEEIIGWRKNIYSYPPVGTSDAGAYTTAGDLDLFWRALKDNQLLSKDLTEEILSPKELHIENEKRKFYMGYGFEYHLRKRDGGIICISKDGSNTGVACVTRYYPELDMTVTLLNNTDACNVWNLIFAIQEQLGIAVE